MLMYLKVYCVNFFIYIGIGHFRVPKTLTLTVKRGQMQNLSCENELYLHDNKKSFTQERFCPWPRFKTGGCFISEMTY